MHVYNFTWLLNFDFKFKYYHFNFINGLAFSSASGEQAYFMTQWGKKGKSLLLSCPKYVMKQKQPYILTLLVLVLQCKHLCALSWLVLKTRSGLLRHQREKVKKKKEGKPKSNPAWPGYRLYVLFEDNTEHTLSNTHHTTKDDIFHMKPVEGVIPEISQEWVS